MIDSDSDWSVLMAPNLAIAVAVLEEEHITRAAVRLGIPQPTVSAAMRRLAEEIGAPLVQGSGRGIVATAAGRALLPAAREALMTLRAARGELQDLIDPDRGRVSLGFLHTLGVRDVPLLLGAFLGAYPDITFQLKQGPAAVLVEQMRSGTIDVAIVAPPPSDDEALGSVLLRDEELYLSVGSGHRLATRRSVALRQAAGETFIALTRGHGLRQVFDERCVKAGFEAKLVYEGEDVATLRGLVGAGLGVAMLPHAIESAGAVVDIPIVPRAHRHVTALWPTDRRLTPTVRRFVDFLIESGPTVVAGG
jgi:LysR family transcriptional activator of glutamate synthase operon